MRILDVYGVCLVVDGEFILVNGCVGVSKKVVKVCELCVMCIVIDVCWFGMVCIRMYSLCCCCFIVICCCWFVEVWSWVVWWSVFCGCNWGNWDIMWIVFMMVDCWCGWGFVCCLICFIFVRFSVWVWWKCWCWIWWRGWLDSWVWLWYCVVVRDGWLYDLICCVGRIVGCCFFNWGMLGRWWMIWVLCCWYLFWLVVVVLVVDVMVDGIGCIDVVICCWSVCLIDGICLFVRLDDLFEFCVFILVCCEVLVYVVCVWSWYVVENCCVMCVMCCVLVCSLLIWVSLWFVLDCLEIVGLLYWVWLLVVVNGVVW